MITIGEIAKRSGLTAKMIRHYESLGLLPAPARSEAGYRSYQEKDVQQLRFIKQARELGFSLPQIGELLSLWHDQHRTSAKVKELALTHIEVLQDKIKELEQMKHSLEMLVNRCHGDDNPDCPILDELARTSNQSCSHCQPSS